MKCKVWAAAAGAAISAAIAGAPAVAQEAKIDCAATAAMASRSQVLVPAHFSGRTVIGNGRLHLHSAPHQACRNEALFVVTGDQLDAYATSGDYTYVHFLNPKTWQEADGWVLSARLKETGSGLRGVTKRAF